MEGPFLMYLVTEGHEIESEDGLRCVKWPERAESSLSTLLGLAFVFVYRGDITS